MRSQWVRLLLIAAILSSGSASAQTDAITLDHVDGLRDDGTLECGVPVQFYLRLTNAPGGGFDTTVLGSANGFRLYSPDGATWHPQFLVDTQEVNCFPEPCETVMDTSYYGRFLDPDPQGPLDGLVWNGSDPQIYDGGIFVVNRGIDGSGADSVLFAGFKQTSGTGIIEPFDEISFKIGLAYIDCESGGQTLCLDSSYLSPAGEWLWSGFTPDYVLLEYKPFWDGPHCFTIAAGCCQGIRGNIDDDELDEINVMDLTYLVAYMFRDGPAPPCTEEADVTGVADSGDIVDLTYLVAYVFRSGPPLADCP